MKTVEEIIFQANKYLELYPQTTAKELGIALNISPRFMKKLMPRLNKPVIQEAYQS